MILQMSGTGQVAGAMLDYADENVKLLATALECHIEVLQGSDETHDGRYEYILCCPITHKYCHICMPGRPIGELRVYDAPKLFVNGEPHSWGSALNVIQMELTGERQMRVARS